MAKTEKSEWSIETIFEDTYYHDSSDHYPIALECALATFYRQIDHNAFRLKRQTDREFELFEKKYRCNAKPFASRMVTMQDICEKLKKIPGIEYIEPIELADYPAIKVWITSYEHEILRMECEFDIEESMKWSLPIGIWLNVAKDKEFKTTTYIFLS